MNGFTAFPASALDLAEVMTTSALPLAFCGTGDSNLVVVHPLCLLATPASVPEFKISIAPADRVGLVREEKLMVAGEPVLGGKVPWVSESNPIMTIAGFPQPGLPDA
jgi:hypothetical protein